MEGLFLEAADMGIPCNMVKNRANSVQTGPDMGNPCKTMQFVQEHGITMLFTFSWAQTAWECHVGTDPTRFFVCNVAKKNVLTWKNHVPGNPN